MKKLRLLAISLIVLSACSKPDNNNNNNNNPGCTKPATPTASAASASVNFGESIKLSATTVANATYKWSGPNFSSTEQNPQIDNAVPGMSGKYYVKVTVGTCVSDSASTDVSVGSITLPCSIAENSGTVTPSSTGSPVDVSLIPYCLAKGKEYQITAQDSTGTYGVIANFSSIPTKTGIYYTTDLALSGPFACYITAQNTKTNRNYHSVPGNYVFVTVNNGNIKVEFCGVNLTDPAFTNDNMIVTASITCQ